MDIITSVCEFWFATNNGHVIKTFISLSRHDIDMTPFIYVSKSVLDQSWNILGELALYYPLRNTVKPVCNDHLSNKIARDLFSDVVKWKLKVPMYSC